MKVITLNSVVSTTATNCSFGKWLELKPQIAIDRKFLQRKMRKWSVSDVQSYLKGMYRGHVNIDNFVLVKIDSIIKVLEDELKRIVKSKELEDDKSQVEGFIARVTKHKTDGKVWMLINGQHRDNSMERWWSGEIPTPSNFTDKVKLTVGEYETEIEPKKVNGIPFPKLDSEIKEALMGHVHPITLVESFEDMEDLADIVRLHNTGNAWNKNEWRAISPSYIMQKFSEMNEYQDFKTVFKCVGGKNDKYHVAKKGVVCFLTHQYYGWFNKKESNWTEIPSWTSSKYDDMAMISSKLWTTKSVDDFLTFAKKVASEYVTLTNTYFKGKNKSSNGKLYLKNSIATFRNYFNFRIILDTQNHPLLSDVYKVKNPSEFAAQWAKQENNRQSDYEYLNDAGKKLYREHENVLGGLDEKLLKELLDKYANSGTTHRNDLRTCFDGEQLKRVMKRMIDDFLDTYDKMMSKGVVMKQGQKASTTVKKAVYNGALQSTKFGDSYSDISDLLDGTKNHVGHQTAKQNAGDYSVDNLKIEDANYNLSNKENRPA